MIQQRLPRGFSASGVHCGIKSEATAKDVSLIVSDRPAVAAGVYTQNQICAAPVILDRARTPCDHVRAVITNSGNANACTGEQGMKDAQEMVRLTAQACGCEPGDVLVMSTGVIGQPLPMENLRVGITQAADQLAANPAALDAAAAGILTTDLVTKIAMESWGPALDKDHQTTSVVTGIAKGSGMIAPNMATMLAVIMTDAALRPVDADQLLRQISDVTFNRISVDGHTSTNDTVLLLANGAAFDQPLQGNQLSEFADALRQVCQSLAYAIVDDGEGASHVVEIHVSGCATDSDATVVARTIGESPLVKTAISGNDPNWGRIVSAAGYAGPTFDPLQVRLSIQGVPVFAHGTPQPFDESEVSTTMQSSRKIIIEFSCGNGRGTAEFSTCDLTAEYVRINADYRS